MKFRTVIFAIVVVLIPYIVGNYLDLFTKLEWFDIPMHFAGGFAMGMLAVWLMIRANFQNNPDWSQLVFAIGVALIAGVLWEYYEFATESFVIAKFGWKPMALRDTLSDLFFDGLGGTVAWYVFKKRI